MKLLREYIRELLTERRGGTVHPKIYDMIARADELGYKVVIHSNSVELLEPNNEQNYMDTIGVVDWEIDPVYGPCLGTNVVTNAKASADGFGPLLYDLAIEITGGLSPDRTTVSDAARDVWDYYYTRRPDVKSEQMDNLENKLTPEEKDNCEQLSASEDNAIGSPRNWDESVLSRKYSKQGQPVYNELRKRGMLQP